MKIFHCLLFYILIYNYYKTNKHYIFIQLKKKGDIQGLSLSQEEKNAYAILYAKAEPSNNGSISGNQAVNFLSKSKLSFDILSEVNKIFINIYIFL